ncbi:sulfite exporter TauE/SafE family protein [Pedobacter sp. P351]|uniref:sulfite exporter TauE/SafE family protein n=1 Tax=Pedobacter superstes TaxID=3133441 RepID=UPI0030B44B32
MSYEALAFFTGLFGSLHCVAMCGPLILALPFSNQSIWTSILHRLLYQAGRILMYGFLGLLIGLIGTGFSLLKMQQTLSLITGILLITAGISHFIKGRKLTNRIFSLKLLPVLTSLLGRYLSKPYGGFIAGALNGILPCGVTYIALAQAINLTTPIEAGRFMLFFGLGTVPLLFATALSPLFFRKLKAPVLLIPILFLLAGSFLMARGLNLSIPYVSHSINLNEPENCK